jgi:hypothetical protein
MKQSVCTTFFIVAFLQFRLSRVNKGVESIKRERHSKRHAATEATTAIGAKPPISASILVRRRLRSGHSPSISSDQEQIIYCGIFSRIYISKIYSASYKYRKNNLAVPYFIGTYFKKNCADEQGKTLSWRPGEWHEWHEKLDGLAVKNLEGGDLPLGIVAGRTPGGCSPSGATSSD